MSWYQKGKTNLILLKQETVSGSGISWAVCRSAPCSRQITTLAPHHSVFFADWMPFQPPNQQRQSTEGNSACFLQCQEYILHPFNGPLSMTTRVSRYQKGKTNLDFTGARDSEWQWHQLGHMQICTSLQTDYHASTPPLSFFYSVKALKEYIITYISLFGTRQQRDMYKEANIQLHKHKQCKTLQRTEQKE